MEQAEAFRDEMAIPDSDYIPGKGFRIAELTEDACPPISRLDKNCGM
jgi:hypothetical protein